MKLSLFYTVDTWIIALAQVVLMLFFIRAGRWMGRNRSTAYAENPGNETFTTSIYALFGLLTAFTFGMSGDRFNNRKATITSEANAIGTAILRIELYADSVQSKLRPHFREYLEARIQYYEARRDTAGIRRALASADESRKSIWTIVTTQSRVHENFVASNQMVPALNEMFDLVTTRFWGEYNRTPSSILTMLFVFSFATAIMIGYTSVGKGKFDWRMAVAFSVLSAIVIFFIIDLDKPRSGIITLDKNEKAISELRGLLAD